MDDATIVFVIVCALATLAFVVWAAHVGDEAREARGELEDAGVDQTLAAFGFTERDARVGYAILDGIRVDAVLDEEGGQPTVTLTLTTPEGRQLAPGVSVHPQGMLARGDGLLGDAADDALIRVEGDRTEVRLRFDAEARAAMIAAVTRFGWSMEGGVMTWRGRRLPQAVGPYLAAGLQAARALSFGDRTDRWVALIASDPSPIVRRDAFRRMRAEGPDDEAWARACEAARGGNDPTLRAIAAASLERVPSADELAEIADGLAHDPAPLDGVAILARFGDVSHVPSLRALAGGLDRAGRERVEAAIATIQSGRAAGALTLSEGALQPGAAALSLTGDP